jgi:hypothetical protein
MGNSVFMGSWKMKIFFQPKKHFFEALLESFNNQFKIATISSQKKRIFQREFTTINRKAKGKLFQFLGYRKDQAREKLIITRKLFDQREAKNYLLFHTAN